MSETMWNHLTAPLLRELARQDALVLMPIGSTEQHGPHLPTGVDDILATEVCRRTAARLSEMGIPVVVAPTVWCGLADQHVSFGGTFTLTLATYHAVLRDLCRSILMAGFGRIVLVNSHGGNAAALGALSVELTRELNAQIATTTYFVEGAKEAAGILEDQDNFMHACEAETSMIMAVAPDLVDRAHLSEAHGPAVDIFVWLLPSLKRSRAFKEMTKSGVIGDARRASPAKGEALLDLYARELAGRLQAGQLWADPSTES